MIDVPVEVKDVLREGTYKKNYRFVVLNEDGTPDETIGTIDNDNLVSESVSIDERMCSGDTLKFGLCEGSSLEFQYFNKPNITGKRVQAFVDVQYRVGIMGRIDAEGSFTVSISGTYTFELKDGSATGLYITYAGGGDMYVDFVLGQTTDTEELEAGDVVTLNNPSSDALFEVSTDMWDTIPMGFFDVKKCSRQASTGIIKVTAYNKLQSDYLDAKANLLIDESFTASSVYLIDILRVLLKDYGINPKEYEYITPTTTFQTSVESNAKDYFTKFKYSSLYGDQGPFSPTVIQGNYSISTSTNFGISEVTYFKRYSESAYPIQFEIDNKIEAIDTNIANFIKENLNKINSSTSGSELWTRLQNSETAISPAFSGYFFQVTVKTSTRTFKYGNNVLNADGTFEDLRRTTFTNVIGIDILIPSHLRFGHLYNDATGSIQYSFNATNPRNYNNTLYCYGENCSYLYRESSSSTSAVTKEYITPKMPDGTDIELANVANMFKVKGITGGLSDADFIELVPADMGEVTLRDLQSAEFETLCQFGQLSRTTDLFSGVELNHSRLYPADSLYPATDLYPAGAALSGFKSMYSKLWADEGNIHKWKDLIITYKGLDGEGNEKDYTLQRQINSIADGGTDDYNCSDNWLFRNLVWTAEQVAEYAAAMVAKMQDMTWFPFEMWCAGLPYLETGDEIEIPLNGESYTSYVLQRQLKGIQSLQDTYINGTLDIF